MSGFERLGIPANRHPRQVYYGAVGRTRRYLAFKRPIAVEADSAVFVYVDPGHATAKSLRSWAAAHQWHKIAPSRSRSMATAPCTRMVIRDSFRVCVKGVSCRSGSVKGTRGWIHKKRSRRLTKTLSRISSSDAGASWTTGRTIWIS